VRWWFPYRHTTGVLTLRSRSASAERYFEDEQPSTLKTWPHGSSTWQMLRPSETTSGPRWLLAPTSSIGQGPP